jgi:adhesin transport system outer membrane protein
LNNKSDAYVDIEKYSPYLKEAKSIIKIYKEKLEQSKVNFYPTLNLIAKKSVLDENYETRDSIETTDTSIALEAKLELYSGGKDSANNDKKYFEYRGKIEKKEDVLREVTYKLDLAFNKYELNLEKKNLLKKLIIKREDSLLGASYDYKFAKIDANDLLDAVDDLYLAKTMYIENKYDLLISKYKIFNTIGLIKDIILENKIKE